MIRSLIRIATSLYLCTCAGTLAGARELRTPEMPGQWSTTFDKSSGHIAATFQTTTAARLRIACDSAGARPGSGSISLSWPIPNAADPVPTATTMLIEGADRSVSLAVSLSLEMPAQPPNARRTGGKAPDTLPVVTAIHALDGSDASARILADIVALLRAKSKTTAVRLPSLGLAHTIGVANQQRALQGFDRGCQNFLPPEDEEVIWDWHQGIETLDGGRSITLVAQAQPHPTQRDEARISIVCRIDRLSIAFSGLPPITGDQPSLMMAGTHGDAVAVQISSGATRDEFIVGQQSHTAVLTLLAGHEKIMVFWPTNLLEQRAFPVAGFRFAARLAARQCPSVNH